MKKRIFLLFTLFLLLPPTLLTPLIEVNKISIDNETAIYLLTKEIIVTLKYIHSVELTEIIEEYRIHDCSIELKRFEWPGYGAGLPSRINDITNYRRMNTTFIIEGEKLNVKYLYIDLKYRVKPELYINGYEVKGDKVLIATCVKISLIEFLLSNVIQQTLMDVNNKSNYSLSNLNLHSLT
jgi:hypothetical protein